MSNPTGSTHPAFLERQWKPGQSGNPRGVHDPITAALREQLAHVEDKRTRAQMIAIELVRIALHGKGESTRVRAIAEVFDRIAGRPQQQLNVEGAAGIGDLIKALAASVTEAA